MNHLDPAQVEQLQEIGAHLRQRRQELSIPIEEIAAKTLIRLGMLKAIEEGQSDQLPEPVFIQGFIRRYGDALGLDGTALAKTFPIGFSLPAESDVLIQEPRLPRSRTIPLYVAFILLVVVAAGGLLYFLRQRTTAPVVQRQSPQQQTTVATVRSSPSAKPSSSPTPIQATVNLKDQSWLRVMADGKTQFEGVLTKGHQQTWKAKKQLTVRAGNAGAVLISFNREKPKLLGAPGKIQEVTFTKSQQAPPL